VNIHKLGKQQKLLGLALGGGGARGLAHIGVLKVLSRNGIKISCLSGCSMGGIIASTYAIGLSIDEIENIAKRLNSKREILKLVDRTPNRRGLLAGKNVRKYLSNHIDPTTRIEDSLIPLCMNAVDLISGKEILLDKGNLIDSIMATTAVPGFFPPVEIGPYRLVDGGVLDDVPVKYLKGSVAEVILAVDVHQQNQHNSPINDARQHEHIPMLLPGIVQDFYRVEMIMTSTLVEKNMQEFPPDLLINPAIPDDITSLFGFNRVNEIIRAGEEAMESKLSELFHLLTN